MNGFGSRSSPSPDGEVLVVVHPAGRLDDAATATYWTEVPALPACHAEGATVEEVVSVRREAIGRWTVAAEVRVELAF